MKLLRFLLDLKIKWKLILGFAAVGGLLVAGTGVGLTSTILFNNNFQALYLVHLGSDRGIAEILDTGIKIQNSVDTYVMTQKNLQSLKDIAELKSAEVDQSFNQLGMIEMDSIMKFRFDAFKNAWKEYKTGLTDALNSFSAGEMSTDQKEAVIQKLDDSMVKFQSTASDMRSVNFDAASEDFNQVKTEFGLVVAFLVGAGLMGVAISQFLGIKITMAIIRPLEVVRKQMRRLSAGESDSTNEIISEKLLERKDEMGDLVRDLELVNEYIHSVGELADQVAQGNLAVTIKKRSDADQLSQGLARMLEQLSGLVEQMSTSSEEVGQASQRLLQAANETSNASGQITTTIQQVSQGINKQSSDMNQAVSVIDATNQAIERVARGASEQESAISETVNATGQMDEAIQQMIANVNQVSSSAGKAMERAEDGAGTLRLTVKSMEVIRTQVEDLDKRVSAMGDRSNEIGSIIEVIEEIATKTNILAINATIEAAHAEVQAKRLTEELLGQMMIAECQMVNQMLLEGAGRAEIAFWKSLCDVTGLDSILVTDEDGVTLMCNEEKLIGWKFPEDPKAQAYPFRQLLKQTNGTLNQEAASRSLDNKVFKYVGVSRADRTGIVQVGFNMGSMKKYDLRISGFAVVASEVYQLAERARESTREIRSLIKGIQSTVGEAMSAMQKSRREVEVGMDRAGSAGTALEQILEGVQDVTQQVSLASNAVERMGKIAKVVAGEVDTFSRIVDGNNRAVEEMNSGYKELAQTIESIASLSEENSAAAEEVSASSEEMRAQMEEVDQAAESLEEMANQLRQVVARFRLSGEGNTVEDEQHLAREGGLVYN
jgi:methyl-accepting chemotaxis protein